jgi:hypothetical protein
LFKELIKGNLLSPPLFKEYDAPFLPTVNVPAPANTQNDAPFLPTVDVPAPANNQNDAHFLPTVNVPAPANTQNDAPFLPSVVWNKLTTLKDLVAILNTESAVIKTQERELEQRRQAFKDQVKEGVQDLQKLKEHPGATPYHNDIAELINKFNGY